MPARYEAARFGLEVRPILAWSPGPVRLAANPIVAVPLTGGPATFEPAAQALYEIGGAASFGLEYYAGLGALTERPLLAGREQYLYEVVNVVRWPRLELEAGVGEGLTSSSGALVAKVIVGCTFEPLRR